jgi:hypothetical protein
MSRLLLLGLAALVAGCGPVPLMPGEDSDPIGAYRFSHGRTYGLLPAAPPPAGAGVPPAESWSLSASSPRGPARARV